MRRPGAVCLARRSGRVGQATAPRQVRIRKTREHTRSWRCTRNGRKWREVSRSRLWKGGLPVDRQRIQVVRLIMSTAREPLKWMVLQWRWPGTRLPIPVTSSQSSRAASRIHSSTVSTYQRCNLLSSGRVLPTPVRVGHHAHSKYDEEVGKWRDEPGRWYDEPGKWHDALGKWQDNALRA